MSNVDIDELRKALDATIRALVKRGRCSLDEADAPTDEGDEEYVVPAVANLCLVRADGEFLSASVPVAPGDVITVSRRGAS